VQFLEQKNYLNDSYTQYKNKVGLTIDGKYLKQRNEVALVWPFKDCILEGGQSREEDKREEIFFNEILAQDEITQLLEPKVVTNAKRIDKKGEHALDGFKRDVELNRKRGLPEDTITDNLIIKGNNLLALHTLKEEFAGKVRLIYIDPPYNTGSDSFKYNDSFTESTWLTFMHNRLKAAHGLLHKSGVLLVQINDHNQTYLKILLDEDKKIKASIKRAAFHEITKEAVTEALSIGHIRDLPKSNKDAIDIPAGFVPRYEISKGKDKKNMTALEK
jgi:adenine-specific DNA-methyltransferase